MNVVLLLVRCQVFAFLFGLLFETFDDVMDLLAIAFQRGDHFADGVLDEDTTDHSITTTLLVGDSREGGENEVVLFQIHFEILGFLHQLRLFIA